MKNKMIQSITILVIYFRLYETAFLFYIFQGTKSYFLSYIKKCFNHKKNILKTLKQQTTKEIKMQIRQYSKILVLQNKKVKIYNKTMKKELILF